MDEPKEGEPPPHKSEEELFNQVFRSIIVGLRIDLGVQPKRRRITETSGEIDFHYNKEPTDLRDITRHLQKICSEMKCYIEEKDNSGTLHLKGGYVMYAEKKEKEDYTIHLHKKRHLKYHPPIQSKEPPKKYNPEKPILFHLSPSKQTSKPQQTPRQTKRNLLRRTIDRFFA